MSVQPIGGPPPNRGPLLDPEQVAALLGLTPAWVRKHVPHKIVLGHRTVKWFEDDVRRYLERLRAST